MKNLLTALCLILALAFLAAAQTPASFDLKVTQKASMTYSPKTSSGAAAVLDGPVAVSCAPVGIVAVTSNAPFKDVTALAIGTTVCTFSAASYGQPVSETVTFNVLPDPAVTLGIAFGVPGPK